MYIDNEQQKRVGGGENGSILIENSRSFAAERYKRQSQAEKEKFQISSSYKIAGKNSLFQ